MNEIVKYGYELNTVQLRKWNENELDLFYSLLSAVKDKGGQVLTFTFEQLQGLSEYKRSSPRFIKDLESISDKLIGLTYTHRDLDGSFKKSVLFTDVEAIIKDEILNIRVNNSAVPHLNKVVEKYVMFPLKEVLDLKSSYSKIMLTKLKQWRTVGKLEFTKEQFFEELDIPKTYLKKEINVTNKVLMPIKEELTSLFPGLSVSKVHGKGRGKPVVGYKFTWKPQHTQYIENDHSTYKPTDEKTKLKYIRYNANLSEQEKWRAEDRIRGLKLGTTEKLQSEQKKKQELIDSLDEKSRDQYDMFMRINQPEFAEGILEAFQKKMKLSEFKLDSETRNYIKPLAN